MSKTVAVIGANSARRRYSNKSLRAHESVGWTVIPVNPSETEVEGHRCYASLKDVPESVDRVTMYVRPEIGMGILDDIAAKNPKEFWLNPGTESRELIQRAKQLGLEPILGCSIIDLGVSPADFPDR
jgi:Predicted CoA-binding protein